MSAMFKKTAGATMASWTVGDLGGWDVSKVEDMSFMFYEAGLESSAWTVGNLGYVDANHPGWNTENVATMEGMRFKEHEFELHPGDSLFVYTDGVAEATNANNELFGPERTLDALNTDPNAEPKAILANVMKAIDSFVAGAEQFDDITMLCFKYNGSGKK